MDIFVVKEHRKSGHAAMLANMACAHGVEAGCEVVTGSVDPRTDSATDSMKVLLAYGMRVHSIREPLIYFIKEL